MSGFWQPHLHESALTRSPFHISRSLIPAPLLRVQDDCICSLQVSNSLKAWSKISIWKWQSLWWTGYDRWREEQSDEIDWIWRLWHVRIGFNPISLFLPPFYLLIPILSPHLPPFHPFNIILRGADLPLAPEPWRDPPTYIPHDEILAIMNMTWKIAGYAY